MYVITYFAISNTLQRKVERDISGGSRGDSMGSYEPPSDSRPVSKYPHCGELILPEHRNASAPTAEFACIKPFNLRVELAISARLRVRKVGVFLKNKNGRGRAKEPSFLQSWIRPWDMIQARFGITDWE